MKIRYTDKFKKFAPLRVGELDDLADEMALEIIRKGYAVKYVEEEEEDDDAANVGDKEGTIIVNEAPLIENRKKVAKELRRMNKKK